MVRATRRCSSSSAKQYAFHDTEKRSSSQCVARRRRRSPSRTTHAAVARRRRAACRASAAASRWPARRPTRSTPWNTLSASSRSAVLYVDLVGDGRRRRRRRGRTRTRRRCSRGTRRRRWRSASASRRTARSGAWRRAATAACTLRLQPRNSGTSVCSASSWPGTIRLANTIAGSITGRPWTRRAASTNPSWMRNGSMPSISASLAVGVLLAEVVGARRRASATGSSTTATSRRCAGSCSTLSCRWRQATADLGLDVLLRVHAVRAEALAQAHHRLGAGARRTAGRTGRTRGASPPCQPSSTRTTSRLRNVRVTVGERGRARARAPASRASSLLRHRVLVRRELDDAEVARWACRGPAA